MNRTKKTKSRLVKCALIFAAIFAFVFVSLTMRNKTIEQPFDLVQEDENIVIIEKLTLLSSENKDSIFMVVAKMPKFPGGIDSLTSFINKNLGWPVRGGEHWRGRGVTVQFVIEKTGKISNIEVVCGLMSSAFDQEAMRVIKLMPNWIPGEHRGEKIRVRHILTVYFWPWEENETAEFLSYLEIPVSQKYGSVSN